MFTKSQLEKFLFFDIETAGSADSFSNLSGKMKDLWSHRAEFLRTQMVGKYPDNAEKSNDALFEEKAALQAEFGRVVCVTFGKIKFSPENSEIPQIQLRSYFGEEEDILKKSFALMDSLAKNGNKLVGHNIKRFDIPFLCKRAFINKLEPADPLRVWDKKPWEIPVIDTSEYWSFGAWQEGFTSLELLCTVLGIPSPKAEMHGDEVHSAFYQGAINEIVKYNQGDVLSMIRVAFALSKLPQFDDSVVVRG